MPFERVLVATDFSKPSADAARLGLRLAGPDAIVRLVHVLPEPVQLPLLPTRDRERLEDAALRTEVGARERLEAFARDLGRPELETRVLHGSVGKEVARAAEALQADLIVLGARGHSLIERVLLGSKARATLRQAHVSVLVGRGNVAPPRRVAVTTDFHDLSRTAGERARAIAEDAGAELVAFHAVDTGLYGSALSLAESVGGASHLSREGREELERAMRTMLHRFNEETLGGKAREVLAVGEPVERIVAFAGAEGVDLIVMGSHNPGAVERALLGSVTESVIEKAPCSVLAVHG